MKQQSNAWRTGRSLCAVHPRHSRHTHGCHRGCRCCGLLVKIGGHRWFWWESVSVKTGLWDNEDDGSDCRLPLSPFYWYYYVFEEQLLSLSSYCSYHHPYIHSYCFFTIVITSTIITRIIMPTPVIYYFAAPTSIVAMISIVCGSVGSLSNGDTDWGCNGDRGCIWWYWCWFSWMLPKTGFQLEKLVAMKLTINAFDKCLTVTMTMNYDVIDNSDDDDDENYSRHDHTPG